ncbi:MAG: MgtC/SapB family protein [Dehalococcoidales bacterium]|nr:MgtC/SapB family protein [Dehalococcoidales bacterium]MDD5591405.1 MgtC/SapB family protein [Dehalococcoidales bacterium]
MPVELQMVIRILAAAGMGAAIGYEREKSHKPAGLRTHILIAVGAALFTVASVYGFGPTGDISRVAAGVVAGIGFIGAGAIIHRGGGDIVEGLTTAATIWAVAAVGLAAGAGLYPVAGATTGITLAILLLPRHIR